MDSPDTLTPRFQPQLALRTHHDTAAWQVAAMMQARTSARDWVRYGLDGDACAQFLAEIEADAQALHTSGRQWLMRLAGCLLQWADESGAEARRHEAGLLEAAKTLDPRQIGPQRLHGLGHDGLLMLMDAQKERSSLLHAKYACLQQAALVRSAITMAARCIDTGASAAMLLMVFDHAMSVHETAAQALEDMIDCASRFEHDLSHAEEALERGGRAAVRNASATSRSAQVAAWADPTDPTDPDAGRPARLVGTPGVAVAGAIVGLALQAQASAHTAPAEAEPAPTPAPASAPAMTVNPVNGLPMIDDAVDIHGNAFGTNSVDDAFDHMADHTMFPAQEFPSSAGVDAGFAPDGNVGSFGNDF